MNLPYVTPLDTNSDSRKILQTLSEQCEEYDQRVESETEEVSNSSEEDKIIMQILKMKQKISVKKNNSGKFKQGHNQKPNK